jgi:ATP phosphoribosyltransferase
VTRPDPRGPHRSQLRLALPVKGRLAEPTKRLFDDAGFVVDGDPRRLQVVLDDHDLEILLARSEDIPVWVEDRAVQVGVAGRNQVIESGVRIDERLALGYGRCRLQLAVPSTATARAVEDLAGTRIATSYPRTVAAHLASHGVSATLIPISGSVELAPALDAAEAIADLVTSGETLRQNGLVAIDTIIESEAVLVAPPNLEPTAERRVTELVTVLASVLEARPKRYLMLNTPDASLDAVLRLLPGIDAPTVVPLARHGMHAVHAVVAARDLTRLLAPLKAAGATGILVLPIEHLVA